MLDSLTFPQQLVYERLNDNYRQAVSANKLIGDRTTVIVGGATAISTAVGASLSWSNVTTFSLSFWLLAASSVASLLAFSAAGFIWAPMTTSLPGPLNVDEIWLEVFNGDDDAAVFATAVNDLVKSLDDELACNSKRSKAFIATLILAWMQVTCVFLAACLS